MNYIVLINQSGIIKGWEGKITKKYHEAGMDGYKNIFGKKLRDSLMHMYEYEWLIGMLKTRVKWDEYFRVLLEIAVPVYMRQLE